MAEKKKVSDPSPEVLSSSGSDSDDEPPPKPPKPGPIIGPDGKEIPRPTDKDGNPLPIYVSPEGKPILDDAGRPIVVRVDENGKPIPYHDLLAYQQSNQGMVQEQQKETKMSKSYIYVGVGDFIISVAFAILAAAFLGPAATKITANTNKNAENYHEEYIHCLVTLIVEAIGAASAFLVIIAGYANKRGYFYGWFVMCIILIIPQVAIVSYGQNHLDYVAFPSMLHCIFRGLLICCCAMGMGIKDKDKDTKYPSHPVSSQVNGSYPVQRGGGGQTVIIRQQPQTTYVQSAPVIVHHAPIYGYGYGYPYYGYHPADSLAMGMMAGAMMGGYGYGYDYGYGDYW